MSAKEPTIKFFIDALTLEIVERKREADSAFKKLEVLGLNAEEYNEACLVFGIRCYVVSYLSHIRTLIEHTDIKTAERRIRLHAHYQREKGAQSNDGDTSIAQAMVAAVLDDYIEKFFEEA